MRKCFADDANTCNCQPTAGNVCDGVIALRKDAERYRWQIQSLHWAVTYEPRRTTWPMRYRMLNDGEPWGQWHSTPGAAIDAAMLAYPAFVSA